MPIHEDQNDQLILYPCSSPAAVVKTARHDLMEKRRRHKIHIVRADSKRQQPDDFRFEL